MTINKDIVSFNYCFIVMRKIIDVTLLLYSGLELVQRQEHLRVMGPAKCSTANKRCSIAGFC
jgi:hypothetical protein